MPSSKLAIRGIYPGAFFCSNRSQDLRLFLGSIFWSRSALITAELKVFLTTLLQRYNSSAQRFINNGDPGWWYFYKEVLNEVDANFYPEVLLEKIGIELAKI
jgi:hypothetical protein